MTKFSIFFLLHSMSLAITAQQINGDINYNNTIDIEDVTMLINDYLKDTPHYISSPSSPFTVDNSYIKGIWYSSKGDSITFGEDNLVTLDGVKYRYKLIPSHGRLLLFDQVGKFQFSKDIYILEDNYLLMDSKTGNKEWTKTPPPFENGYEFVDLGLPSGTLWATRNVGASSPEIYGNYYAWGETTTKSTYNWSTYNWCQRTSTTMTKYCTETKYGTVDNKTVLEPNDDIAHLSWGGKWRIPTKEEMEELIDPNNCTCAWTKLNSENGYIITSKSNGNSIFLPAVGYKWGNAANERDAYGYYWSSAVVINESCGAHGLYFSSEKIKISNYIPRYYGVCVRPVFR